MNYSTNTVSKSSQQVKYVYMQIASHKYQWWAARQIVCELQTWLKFIQVPKKLNFWLFSSSFFTIDFKICLYARCFDTSHCPHDIFWLHLVNCPKLWKTIWSLKTWMKFIGTFCFLKVLKNWQCNQNMSCGQCELSKCLVYRHILKSIVKKLERKNQKFTFSKLDLNFCLSVCVFVCLCTDHLTGSHGSSWDVKQMWHQ